MPGLPSSGETPLSRDEYYLRIAWAVAAGAKCTRDRVGAVIVNDNRLVGAGKNGAAPGQRECTDGACPRGKHYAAYTDGTFDLACGCGNAWPCPDSAPPGSDYDRPGPHRCISQHAELNACMDAGRKLAKHGTIYVTREPCFGCVKAILAAQILRLVYPWEKSLRSLDSPFLSW